MSTYNGEKYLDVQIDSILEQSISKMDEYSLKLVIRDDGSSDATVDILRGYESKYPDIINVIVNDNKGVVESFFELLHNAPESDYYAFSDQDDFWLPDKLLTAIKIIDEKTVVKDRRVPVLYACAPTLVDEELNPIESKIKRDNPVPGFKNALVENICVGCTEVFNKELYRVVYGRKPEFTVMHDFWMYMVACCFGRVYYDNDSYIKYRQHEDNVLGMKTNIIKEYIQRIKLFKGRRRNLSRQMKALTDIYGGIVTGEKMEYVQRSKKAVNNLVLINKILELRESKRLSDRIYLINKVGLYRQRKADNFIFKIILFSGSF